MSYRKTGWLLAVAVALVLGGCVGRAQPLLVGPGVQQTTATPTVIGERSLRLAFAAELNADCSKAGDSVIQIIEPPVNGRASIAATRGFTSFNPFNQRAACNKAKSSGLQLSYRANPGYSGPDTMVADIIFSSGRVVRTRYDITVR